MNIYCLEITALAFEDQVWAQGENALDAIRQAYGDFREDFIANGVQDADELSVKVSLTQKGMTMEEFEAANPDFFFT